MHTEATLAQPDVSELDLVKQCQAGQTEAFDQLVNRYRSRVFAMIYNMVHNEQDAWDLAQDSFVKAWKSIKRFRGQSSFYTWLYRIVMNVTIDHARKKQIKGAGTEFNDEVKLGEIEPAAHAGMAGWQFGCDICQDVCPWNRGVEKRRAGQAPPAGAEPHVSLVDWLEQGDEELAARYERLFVPRNDPRYLRRNALVALGNAGGDPALAVPYAESDDPFLREHADWALDRLGARG